MKDDERCIICNKKLKTQGPQSDKCSSCGVIFSRLKYKYPKKSDNELCTLSKKKLKIYKSKHYACGSKPKFLKVKS